MWPLFPDEDEEPELVRPQIRYTAAAGTFAVLGLCGAYFFYAPSRMVTRLTVYPATQMLGVRTAAPAPSRWLPAALRQRAYFQRAGPLSADDVLERRVPLEAVYRLQGSAVSSELAAWRAVLKKAPARVPPAVRPRLAEPRGASDKYDEQETLMLRVGDARLAFQLGARPDEHTLLNTPPPSALKAAWRRVWRGPTDWADAPGYDAAPAEREARAARARGDTEPWFLDRAGFDQLFPLDASRYKKKK